MVPCRNCKIKDLKTSLICLGGGNITGHDTLSMFYKWLLCCMKLFTAPLNMNKEKVVKLSSFSKACCCWWVVNAKLYVEISSSPPQNHRANNGLFREPCSLAISHTFAEIEYFSKEFLENKRMRGYQTRCRHNHEMVLPTRHWKNHNVYI